MNVALGSIFRNASGHVPRFLAQCVALDNALKARGDSLRLILAEGDSIDNTWKLLSYAADTGDLGIDLFKRNHGGPHFGSTIHPQRMVQLAYVANGVLSRVTLDDDAFIYVESDLIWPAETMVKLLDDLQQVDMLRRRPIDLVAPMTLHHNGRFYDTWAYRKDGKPFGFYPPFHPDIDRVTLTPLDSAGSCLAMRGEVARRALFPSHTCIVGLCERAIDQGYQLYLDPTVSVVHPPDGSEADIPGVTP